MREHICSELIIHPPLEPRARQLRSTSSLSCLGRLGLLSGGSVFPEAVLEPPRNTLQMPHPSSTSGLSALSLLAPLVRTQLGTWVAALATSFVLPMEGSVSASTADRVRFRVSFTERSCAFRLEKRDQKNHQYIQNI